MTSKTHFPEVVSLLRMEANAIAATDTRLSEEQVERVMSLLAGCKGKVVIVGVGKSGIIAQKIAATMTSTGTAALHLHPSDALHGGLGIVNVDDVVMILSNSGETDEIVAMLPYLKNQQVPIIAVVGNLNSTLANRADAVLDASVDQEACPLNLAPTTSTTVALALGDALAMTLMKRKGLTLDDFAVNHPAGRLGKRLTLTVADLMHGGNRNPTLAYDALRLMEDRPSQISVLPVVDGARACVGLIRLHDIVRSGL